MCEDNVPGVPVVGEDGAPEGFVAEVEHERLYQRGVPSSLKLQKRGEPEGSPGARALAPLPLKPDGYWSLALRPARK
jgi:hypothetical protein